MPELITDLLTSEYDTLIANVGDEASDDQIVTALARDADWDRTGRA